MKFEVTILGSSSATPIFNRNPSAQLLNANERCFLIDCGEGTQLQLLKYGLKAQRIEHIFISHLHGDHYLGLVGLLSSLHLNGRSKEMHIYAPAELQEIIEIQLLHSQTLLRYPLIFHPTNREHAETIFENQDLIVSTFVLEHRIPCTGFRFSQKPRLNQVIREKAEAARLPVEAFSLLKRGIDYISADGVTYAAAEYTKAPGSPRSYAYCSDTIASGSYLDAIRDADTLYHEATFMHDMIDRASETFHTTALQAGEIAVQAGIGQLLIGHFSARYRDLQPLLDECRSVFENSRLAIEGTTFNL